MSSCQRERRGSVKEDQRRKEVETKETAALLRVLLYTIVLLLLHLIIKMVFIITSVLLCISLLSNFKFIN